MPRSLDLQGADASELKPPARPCVHHCLGLGRPDRERRRRAELPTCPADRADRRRHRPWAAHEGAATWQLVRPIQTRTNVRSTPIHGIQPRRWISSRCKSEARVRSALFFIRRVGDQPSSDASLVHLRGRFEIETTVERRVFQL